MFRLSRPPLDRHFVAAGRVYCPLRCRDIEADGCSGCRWLIAIDENPPASVRCRPDPVLAASLRSA